MTTVLHRWALISALAIFVAGCATTTNPGSLAANDRFEPTNRQVFQLNRKLDKYVVIPTVGVYIFLVPEWGRTRVHDLLGNLALPIIFANDVLQGEFRLAGQSLERFAVNATIGLGGLFDPATSFHIPSHGNDFGVTLAVWGFDEGPYLVLPMFGPSNPRDTTGLLADYFIDPLHWLHYKQHIWWDAAHEYFTLLDLRAQTYQTVQGIERTSVDFYSSQRSLYRQLRNAEIRHGRPAKDLPEF